MENFGESITLSNHKNKKNNSEKTKKYPLDKLEFTKDGYVIEHKGNPKIGTVYYLRQLHVTPDSNLEKIKEVGKYQLEIFKELSKLKIKHIFSEGLYDDIDPKNALLKEEKISSKDYLKKLQNKNYNELSNKEILFLAKLGGAFAYYLANDDIYLHKVMSKENNDKLNEKFKKFGLSTEGIRNQREEIASKEIKQFLKKHPGEKVALIFGIHHYFTDNLKKFNPNVYVKKFDYDETLFNKK